MNRRLALLLIFIVCSGVGASFAQEPGLEQAPPPPPMRVAPPSPTATSDQLDEQADRLRAQKSYLDAIDYYRAALKARGTVSPATVWNKLGITQLQLGRVDDARKSFEKSIKMDKKYADARNNLGVVYYIQKKYSKAIKNYRQAIALRESASFFSNLGAAYFSKKEFPRAVAEYQHALLLDPDILDRTSSTGVAAQLSSPSDRAHFSYVLAKMYAQSGNFARSIECLRKAMEEGYKGIDDVYKDQEFAGVRKDPRFAELMASKPVAIPQ